MVASAASTTFASYMPAAPGKAEPTGLRWKDRVIKIAISASMLEASPNIKTGSDVLSAIRNSILAWESSTDIRIELEISNRSSVSPSGVSGDGVSLVTIASTPENVLLFSKDPQAESAKTRVFYNRRNNITEADVVLNPFQQFSTDGTFGTFDLELTLTHEIGHLLGLRHTKVLGATMSGSLPKNGTFGESDISGRTLSTSDIAAIRELYGIDNQTENCCSTILGRLSAGALKPLKGLSIWAEESSTGLVSSMSEIAPDGTFKLGGLASGTYTVFWKNEAEGLHSQVNLLGTYKLVPDEVRVLNERVTLERSDVKLNYIGLNSQLTDTAISLAGGREYTVFLGGQNIDSNKVQIEFNSPFITVEPGSIREQDFGSDISVVSFVVKTHSNTPAGIYSIFATGDKGLLSSLVGALNIQ